jgi:hypothetical protein
MDLYLSSYIELICGNMFTGEPTKLTATSHAAMHACVVKHRVKNKTIYSCFQKKSLVEMHITPVD